jgi:hypothetical protein
VLSYRIDITQIERGAEAFRKMPARLQEHLLGAMMSSEFAVLKEIGDRTPRRTWNLLRSETAELPPREQPRGLGYIGRILIGAEYAAAVEFGKHGPEQVRAHTRSEAFGRPTQPFTVRAHTRQANQPSRPYARPGLEAATPRVQALHVKAVTDTVRDMQGSV